MKRWTLRIAICLVLGCVTTVAVAWGLAWRNPARQYIILDQGDLAIAELTREFGVSDWQRGHWGQSVGTGFQLTELVGDRVGGLTWYYVEHVATGWPRIALVSVSRRDEQAEQLEYGYRIEEDRTPSTEQRLPLRPIWPGFVINTLFYGAIWFGIFFGFASARRAIRKKRGRCPKCNYDLRGNRGGDKGCSECGWGRPEVGDGE